MGKIEFGTHWYRREARVAALRVLDLIAGFTDRQRVVASLYSVDGKLRLFDGIFMKSTSAPPSVGAADLAWLQGELT